MPGSELAQCQRLLVNTPPMGIMPTGAPLNFMTWYVTRRLTAVAHPPQWPRTSDLTIMWSGPSMVKPAGSLRILLAVTVILFAPIYALAATLTAENWI